MSDEAARSTPVRRLWAFLVGTYGTADPRSLGLFRIALGALLFEDVARRLPDLDAHYTNAGWLKNHFMLFDPMSSHQFSLYLAFSSPGEVRVLVAIHLLVCVLLLVGFRTRLMQVLSAVLITSLNSRNIMLENGGWVVLNLLTVWSVFLPLGKRFSVDALLRSWRARREGDAAALNDHGSPERTTTPVVSLGVTALILQWGTIYYFNFVHKTGAPWKDGTAVYYFFQQDRMVTAFGAWVRGVMPIVGFKLLTRTTLVIECSLVVLILSPFATRYLRMVAWILVCCLHLSIDAVVQLGPFSWAMVTMFFLLIPAEAWNWLERHAVARRPPRMLVFDPADGFSIGFCRLVKRFDVLGRVRFEPRPAKGRGVLPRGAKKASRRTLTLCDPVTGHVWEGAAALVELLATLPIPRFLVAWLSFYGVRRLVDTLLASAVRRRTWLSEYFEVVDLPEAPGDAPPPPSDAARFRARLGRYFATACVLFLMIPETSQVLIENHAVPAWLKPKHRPEWMEEVVFYPRLFQGWSMFAPYPPMDDGRLVVDGLTVDGRHFDPLTGKAPSFDVQPKNGFRMDQIWGDFHRRIATPRFSAYWNGLRDFLLNHQELTGRPRDRLVAFKVWFVAQNIPPPGHPAPPPTRRLLFSYGQMNEPHATAPSPVRPAPFRSFQRLRRAPDLKSGR
jgi:hypothetical protein